MNARAEDSFHTFDECRAFVKILAEGGAGFFGMNQSDFNTAFSKVGKNLEERLSSASFFYIQVFYIGSANTDFVRLHKRKFLTFALALKCIQSVFLTFFMRSITCS